MIRLNDIIHSLSLLCRFTGHCKKFYSVAQHSCYVNYLYPHLLSLCHDFPEAYIGDVSKPLKMILPDYKVIEHRITETISEVLKIDLVNLPKEVKEADYFALKVEQVNFMPETDWWTKNEEATKHYIICWESDWSKSTLERKLKEYKPEWF